MTLTADYVRSIFARADQFDARGFADAFAEDGTFHFGVNPVVTGRANIERANANFFAGLAGMRHEFRNIWINDNVSIAEAMAHYVRHDGHEMAWPVVTIFAFTGDKIQEDRIYMDISPLFQQPIKP